MFCLIRWAFIVKSYINENILIQIKFISEAVVCNHYLVVINVCKTFTELHQALFFKLTFPLKMVHLFTGNYLHICSHF